jgi:hypothetical protein
MDLIEALIFQKDWTTPGDVVQEAVGAGIRAVSEVASSVHTRHAGSVGLLMYGLSHLR